MQQHHERPAKAGVKLAAFLARLRRDERGVAAVYFGYVLAGLLPLILIGISLHMASSEKLKLQDALDAATLYAARSNYNDTVELTRVGKDALLANLRAAGRPTTMADLVDVKFWADEQVVKSSAAIHSSALGATNLGFNSIGASSDVMRSVDKLEIVLVLDNTGSMQDDGKLTTLQTQAKKLIVKLKAAANKSTEADPIKIGIVPFSMTVRVMNNVDLATYNETTHSGADIPAWMDGRGRARSLDTAHRPDIFDSPQDRFTLLKKMGVPWGGCVEARFPPFDIQETDASAGDANTLFTPYFWPDERDGTVANTYNNYLKDVIADDGKANKKELTYSAKYTTQVKDSKGNWVNVKPTASTFALDSSAYGGPYVYGPNAGCVHAPITRLTTDSDDSLATTIDNMKAVGETNIAMGLMWGWHVLSPNGPFADGRAYEAKNNQKIIILMTDGDNTMNNPTKSGDDSGSYYGGLGYVWQDHFYNTGTSTSAAGMNNRLKLLCENIKKKNIMIYTIRLAVTSTDTTLKNCATVPDQMYFDVKTVSGLEAAFNTVAGSIDDLRIAK